MAWVILRASESSRINQVFFYHSLTHIMVKHVCSVKAHYSESCLAPLPEDAGVWEKIKHFLHKSVLIDKLHPQCHRYFKSYAALINERKRQLTYKSKFIIHPLSNFRLTTRTKQLFLYEDAFFRLFWELWMWIIFTVAFIIFPLEAMFYKYEKREIFTLVYITTFLDVSCYVDIFFSFRTGYIIKSSREVVLDPRKITK